MSPRPFTIERLTELFQRPHTFWRHDVDYSLAAATKMARLEQELGVSSTYYLMMTSPFYSPMGALAFAAVASSLGHQIGWHVDPRRTPTNRLATMAPGAKISFHCPRPSELWTQFPGVISAFDPIWEGHYYADSRGQFSYGDPEDDGRVHVSIQINLHPEWWFDPHWYQCVNDREYQDFFYESKSESGLCQT
jgi:hypothetical protein